MRHFQHPFAIEVRPWAEMLKASPDAKPETVAFLKWATFIVFNDARLWDTPVKTRRMSRVLDAFEASTPGDWLAVEDADHAALMVIISAPSQSFPPMMTRALLPFTDAIEGALSEKPVAVPEPAP